MPKAVEGCCGMWGGTGMGKKLLLVAAVAAVALAGCAEAELVYRIEPGGDIFARSRVAIDGNADDAAYICSVLAEHWKGQGFTVYKGIDPGEIGGEMVRSGPNQQQALSNLLRQHSFAVEEISFTSSDHADSYYLALKLDLSDIVDIDDIASLPPREAEHALRGLEELILVVAFELPGRLVDSNADRVVRLGEATRLEWHLAYGEQRKLEMRTEVLHRPLPLITIVAALAVFFALAAAIGAKRAEKNLARGKNSA